MINNKSDIELLKIHLANPIYVRFLLKIFGTLEQDGTYETGLNWDSYARIPRDEQLLLEAKRAKGLSDYSFIENEGLFESIDGLMALPDAALYISYSFSMKYIINRTVGFFVFNVLFFIAVEVFNEFFLHSVHPIFYI